MELSDDIIERAGCGETAALVELDRRGFIPAETEDCCDFAERLKRCRERAAAFEQTMAGEAGEFQIPDDDLVLRPADRIPAELFVGAGKATEELYGFAIDWVPGFFKDCGLLFGGGAYAFPPDFFSIFIINEAFATQERWLIYGRQELLAHELCHVARSGFASPACEELHAYQTAKTGFRRRFGGIVHRERDSYVFLGSALVLLAAQVARVVLALPELPIWPFWIPFILCSAFLLWRHLGLLGRYDRAGSRLATACLAGKSRHILFRCTDAEIVDLANLAAADLPAWLAARPDSPRWRVIKARFFPEKPIS
jgi:hypothetical protein